MGRIKIDYGIDLGTTNSALAVISEGLIEVKEVDQSKLVPSCVSYRRNGSLYVGIPAFNNKKDCHLEFKRKMGTDWKTKKNPLLEEEVNAEELSSEVLKKLRAIITKEQFKSVVITVPAMFDMNQVAATKRAGELAGFEQVEILMEPVAAAFSYGFKHKIVDAKYIVFDFGGGTFDAALVKSEGGVMSVVSSEGDNFLGGKDLDYAIVNQILLPYLRTSYDIENLPKDQKEELVDVILKRLADEIKIELSRYESYEILTDIGKLGKDANGIDMEIDKTFSRTEVEKLYLPIFQKAIDCTHKLLQVNSLNIQDINALVLVGGPTQIPGFRQLIADQIMVPDTSLNPMTAIAEGAALYAAQFNNKIPNHGDKIGFGTAESSLQSIELEIEYPATSVNPREPIGIKRKVSKDPYSVIIKNTTTSVQSSKTTLDDVIMVEIDQKKPNSFKVELFNATNDPVPCSPSEFTIIPGISVDGGAPLPYHIGMEIFHSSRGNIFTPFEGLEKDKKLPLVGRTKRELYTSREIRPGNSQDRMLVPIYLAERDAKDSRSIINIYSDTIEISGDDVPVVVPENTQVEFTMRMDISQTMTLEIEFPHLRIDPIVKKMAFSSKKAIKKEQIDNLFKEIEKGIESIRNSEEIYEGLDNLKSKDAYFKNHFKNITNDDYEQIFNDLRSFILEIDQVMDELKWPVLKREIIKELAELEELAHGTKTNNIMGWEKDESDVDHFRKQRDQLFNMTKIDMVQAETLKENIRSTNVDVLFRIRGKEMMENFIRHFNRNFDSIDWKNREMARKEVDRGNELVQSGAEAERLREQLRNIIDCMRQPDLSGIPKT